MNRYQTGYVFEAFGAFHIRYYATAIVDGKPKRVQRAKRLCRKDHKHHSAKCKPVQQLAAQVLQAINAQSSCPMQQEMRVADFWENHYLPYCEETVQMTGQPRKKPSTVRGYKQIWRQHLRGHFQDLTLQEYEPHMGTRFLESLTGTQGRVTLKHIKALGSSLFKRAMIVQQIKINPWHDVQMPDDAVESKRTRHYTLEEIENIVRALVSHLDAQLVMVLSFFLGLRPSEVAALRWEDFDDASVHIRRSVVRGIVGTPKTLESTASLPLIDQVIVPLELWREQCGNPTEGWIFESRNGTPIDLHNMVGRIIVPTLKAKKLEWKGLYAGRRGACTNTIEATGGNAAIAQQLLRHKSMTTTLNIYKKALTGQAFRDGMRQVEAAANRKALTPAKEE